ncbi:two-component system response regulator NarL [Iodobacter fluviatilis]|uniref:LuxR family two component transcriptional regulator n=1 Tax=Iodobacter fluviatilis TaxID=537 RepID=A0A377QA59_9NEIS|nr:two-component system response regulator NarL [Iodobacter fluviatilis]TCU82370.1 LuxR family two component transcriptional regulator [Iodobacter fluviatilis]STQ91595.1 Nitrate/nitrite response regulator protein narL [Iodobacter fluviatilis]
MSDRYTVVVIDDHPLFRKGVIQLLALDSRFNIVGEAASGAEGLLVVEANNPDLVILDLNMKEMDGIATLRAIKELDLDSRVVMLTVSDQSSDLVAAVRAGADGYLLKDMEPEEIIASLAEALDGQMAIPERLGRVLALAMREDDGSERNAMMASLTEREREILGCLANGLSNKLVGRELGIAEGTVKVHVKSLLRKLNFRSRLEAAIWAVEQGIKQG